MQTISAAAVDAALDYASLVDRLAAMFRDGCEVPLRHHHTIPTDQGPDGTLLLMPAWQRGRHIGIKMVTVFPSNAERGLPSVLGVYLLLDGGTGEPLAAIDGRQMTLRRTAAASALASRLLSRPDARRLLMVGAGALAPHLVHAHAAVRPIREVVIWNRTHAAAERLAAQLHSADIAATATDDLAEAVNAADIVSCATLSTTPLIRGEWLRPGAHVDLVGAFTPSMRESDDAAVRRARLFVDTREGATNEAGDIVDPLRRGVIAPADIVADLFELCRGEKTGRQSAQDVTLFKSVGTALEDLAAAELVAERAGG